MILFRHNSLLFTQHKVLFNFYEPGTGISWYRSLRRTLPLQYSGRHGEAGLNAGFMCLCGLIVHE